MKDKLLRMLDANLNRCREGLRVCEDISRFFLDDKGLTNKFKTLRHSVSSIGEAVGIAVLCKSRDVVRDVGLKNDVRLGHAPGRRKATAFDIAAANIERAKESMRVIEECLKAVDGKNSGLIKELRYKTYESEKKLINKLAALRDT